jgi:PKD repeat protein
MNARTWRMGMALVLLMSWFAMAGLAQGVAPAGIIPTPPESSELQVSLWVDHGAYAVGDSITIHYSVNKAAYVYIWDIQPDGVATRLLPGTLGSSNFVTAGDHTLSGGMIAPPLGTEYLQIMATTSPLDPFSYFSPNPESFQAQIEAQILGIVPVTDRSWNVTSFEIVSGTIPSYGTLDIRSVPAGAAITLDGQYVGYSPRTLFVPEGSHRVTISKSGYWTWMGTFFIIGNPTRTVNATLVSMGTSGNQAPTIAFIFSPSNPGVGLWVQFDASASFDSDGTISSYAWTFGDGTTGTGASTWHRFMSSGTYSVKLTATDNDGASASVTEQVNVGPTNLQPMAAFTTDTTTIVPGAWIQFNAATSSDPDGSIASYVWSFGDGTSGTGVSGWHRFTTAGTYLVTLTVTDNKGAQDAVSKSIIVGAPNVPPVAAFGYTPSLPAVSEWLRFDASASYDTDGTIASYRWTFDGGATDTGSSVYRQFTTAGMHSVTLMVTDNRGVTNSVSRQIQVGATQQQSPVALFTTTPSTPSVGTTISLNATSSYDPDGSIVSYQWDLNGDGVNDSSGAVVQVRYLNAGLAVVRLTVIDNSGLSSSISKTIVISPSGSEASGAPYVGTAPGIFVWGTDSWHVTVNVGTGWSSPRRYRIELRTDGTFSSVNQAAGGVAPLGILPAPSSSGRTLIFEGSLQTGSVDYTFTLPGSASLWLSLKLDTDGNGTLEESSSFVYLRNSLVHPTANPFVVGLPSGYSGALVPSLDFRIGAAVTYTETTRFVYWTATISSLEQ